MLRRSHGGARRRGTGPIVAEMPASVFPAAIVVVVSVVAFLMVAIAWGAAAARETSERVSKVSRKPNRAAR